MGGKLIINSGREDSLVAKIQFGKLTERAQNHRVRERESDRGDRACVGDDQECCVGKEGM